MSERSPDGLWDTPRDEERAKARRLLRDWDLRAVRVHSPCGTGRIVWRIWGEGAPVILFHGGAGAWSHWIRNIPALARQHRVIVPDLPGLGESGSPPHPYTPESIADLLAEGIERHSGRFRGSYTRTACIGFSFGGMICGLTAERVAPAVGLVGLIGASGLGGRFDDLAPVHKLPRSAAREELEDIHRQNLAAMMLHDPESIDALALTIQSDNAPRTRVMSPEHALSTKLADSLRRSRLPVHSISGEHCIFSRDIPRRRALLSRIYPSAQCHVIEGAGHWAQYEAAGEVNRLLLGWLG